MDRKRYKLPARFTNDYLARISDEKLWPEEEGHLLNQRESGHYIWLDLTEPQVKDLLDDAEYYGDTTGDWWDESVRPLNNSAKRVAAAIKKQREEL